jgi:hypothetical protein
MGAQQGYFEHVYTVYLALESNVVICLLAKLV